MWDLSKEILGKDMVLPPIMFEYIWYSMLCSPSILGALKGWQDLRELVISLYQRGDSMVLGISSQVIIFKGGGVFHGIGHLLIGLVR